MTQYARAMLLCSISLNSDVGECVWPCRECASEKRAKEKKNISYLYSISMERHNGKNEMNWSFWRMLFFFFSLSNERIQRTEKKKKSQKRKTFTKLPWSLLCSEHFTTFIVSSVAVQSSSIAMHDFLSKTLYFFLTFFCFFLSVFSPSTQTQHEHEYKWSIERLLFIIFDDWCE